MSLNPIDHTAEANRLIAIVTAESTDPRDTLIVARAQVHATLAMAESLRAIVKTDEAIEEVVRPEMIGGDLRAIDRSKAYDALRRQVKR